MGPDAGQGGGRRTFRGSWGAERLWMPPSTGHSKTQGPVPGQLPQTAAGCAVRDSRHGLVG